VSEQEGKHEPKSDDPYAVDQLAREAYAAYCAARAQRQAPWPPMWSWDDMDERTRVGWQAAVAVVWNLADERLGLPRKEIAELQDALAVSENAIRVAIQAIRDGRHLASALDTLEAALRRDTPTTQTGGGITVPDPPTEGT
jgi:hypothetical protein